MLSSCVLNTEIQEFINSNISKDISKIILKGSPFPEISIQELANQIVAKQKSKQKLPLWFSKTGIYYPPKISIEQTSSEITAKYKSELVFGDTIVDITGGFGVDSYYFSKVFKSVIHCEINSELSAIVKHNCTILKSKNIETISYDGIDFLKKSNRNFDCIYIDPSRRNDTKGKVFLLQDCLPNIPENLELFFTKSNTVLIKNSPMLDITQTIKELKFTKEIHIIAVENEVKELLFILEKGYSNTITINSVNLSKKGNEYFKHNYSEATTASYNTPLNYLYEPNSAILKSGGFSNVSEKLKVDKLHKHSHLYTSSILVDFPGRTFKINTVINYDRKLLKKLIPEGKANIATRNFPKTVAEIRKETKLKDGGNIYLFFTKNVDDKNIIVICEKV